MPAPRTELPPSDNPPKYCTEKGCLEEAFSNGKCQKHWAAEKKGTAPKGTRTRVEAAAPVPQRKSREQLRTETECLVIPVMAFLGTFLDESYEPAIILDTPQGKVAQIKPHINNAIEQMLPWMEIYGSSFARAMPWIGLIGGCTTLVMPALEPTIEIIAGVRKPRVMRSRPDDIYTDEYIRAKNRATQKKEDNVPPSNTAASRQVVTVIPKEENKSDPRAEKPPVHDLDSEAKASKTG